MIGLLSTSEVAHLLGIDESTVKRWSDSGDLECIRTKGRHRRFAVSAILQFVQKNSLQVPETAAAMFRNPELTARLVVGDSSSLIWELRKALLEGDTDRALEAFRVGLASGHDLVGFFSNILYPVLSQLDTGQTIGKIALHEFRLAEKTTRTVLARIQNDIAVDGQERRVAVAACYENEPWEIDLDCVCLLLRARGWKVFHHGADVGVEQLVSALEARGAHLVLLSARAVEDGWKFQNDVSAILVPAVKRIGAALALVGPNLARRFGRKLSVDFIGETTDHLTGFLDRLRD